MGQIYRPDNFVFGQSGAGNNWAKGHYTEVFIDIFQLLPHFPFFLSLDCFDVLLHWSNFVHKYKQ